ncbi:kinesin motor domain protein, partial [Ichthyophthirius multifiliis]
FVLIFFYYHNLRIINAIQDQLINLLDFYIYNCTCFVYGMTGSGKTYTMFGNMQQNMEGAFAPYRYSKLTPILKDSLGGNIFARIISCISHDFYCIEKSLNTLKYSQRA